MRRAAARAGKDDSIFHSRAGLNPAAAGPADKLFRRAEACRNAGKLTRMAQLLKAYLRLRPGRPEAAVALALTGRYREALALSAELLAAGGLTPAELSLLGNPWHNIPDPAVARKAIRAVSAAKAAGPAAGLRALHLFLLRAAAGLPPGKPPLLRGAQAVMNAHSGRVLLELGRERKAARLLAEAVKNFPSDEYCCGEFAEALLCCGLEKEALAFMKAKSAVIRSPGFAAWRGQLLLTCGRYAEAAKTLACAPASGSPMSLCWLGAARLRLGGTATALALLRRAAAADPADAEARLWLAEALRVSGQRKPALAAAKRALALKPANPWGLLTAALLAPSAGRIGAGPLFKKFAAAGRALTPPRVFDAAWAERALSRSSCRRPELHFLRLAGRRLVSGA